MIGKRITLALLAIAAGLLAFILLFERHTISSNETEERGARLMQRFVRDRVTRISIERGRERIELVRERSADGNLGAWKLVSPVRADADADAVDGLLGTLEWTDARRKLEGIDAGDRARFGLTQPRIRSSVTVANERISLVIGGEDPQRGGVYAQLGDPSTAFVVGKDLMEALDYDATHFRAKDLFSGISRSRVVALTLRGAAGERRIERRFETWQLVRPVQGLTSEAVVADFVSMLEDIEATRFIEERPRDVSRYGLREELVVTQKEAEGNRERSVKLSVGGACAGHVDERYARADDGPIVCVRASDVQALGKTVDDLREKRLVTARADDIDAIEVSAAGRQIKLQREGTWKLHVQEGGRDVASDASADAVEDLIASFAANHPTAFTPIDDRVLAQTGLNAPTVTFTVRRADERPAEVLRVARARNGAITARRGDEPIALPLPETAATLLDVAPVVFRSRRLLSESEERARWIEIRRGRVTERVERTDDGWRTTVPSGGTPDEAVMRELVARLAHLEAERIVAAQPGAAHGLASPRITVSMHFEGEGPDRESHAHDDHEGNGDEQSTPEAETTPSGPRDYAIKIGTATEGGAFAQLGTDPTVWVIPEALVSTLGRSLTPAP